VELLTEQVEAAHVIVVNKQDLVSPQQLSVVTNMVQSLNDKPPVVVTTSFGRVNVTQMLDMPEEQAASVETTTNTEAVVEQESTNCAAPDCTDPSHDHAHDIHQHINNSTTTTAVDCLDAQCNDPTHSHSHHHHHDHAANDATDTVPSSSTTSLSSTSTDNLGIGNFVYTAARPFCAERLMELLYAWPVPVKDELDLTLLRQAAQEGYSMRNSKEDNDDKSPFVGVLRSKGFMWMSPVAWIRESNKKDEIIEDDSWRHDTAMYWSHAGRHLGITEAGRWWSSVGSRQTMKQFFAHDPAEYDRVLREDFVSEEFGDRRQELVFIGVALQQEAICNALNDCLLTELEMERYRSQVQAILEVPGMLDAV
jgi:G3E family GTPase